MVAHRQVHPGDTDKQQQQQQVRQWSGHAQVQTSARKRAL